MVEDAFQNEMDSLDEHTSTSTLEDETLASTSTGAILSISDDTGEDEEEPTMIDRIMEMLEAYGWILASIGAVVGAYLAGVSDAFTLVIMFGIGLTIGYTMVKIVGDYVETVSPIMMVFSALGIAFGFGRMLGIPVRDAVGSWF